MNQDTLEGMELLQALLEAGPSTDTLQLKIAGKTVPVVYKPMGWMAKSRCVSAATQYIPEQGKNGQMSIRVVFAMDVYQKRALAEMVVSSPIPLTDVVLEKLPEDIGRQLEVIIPDPFATAQQVEIAKKESATSPEAAAD